MSNSRRKLMVAFFAVLTVTIAALAQTPSNGPVNYVYDELGRLIAVIDSSGNAAVYTYDAVGNILSINRYGATQTSLFSFSPKQGAAGTTVTIYGTGFSTTQEQNAVTFNGTAAPIISSSATQLVVQVPTGALSGPISVTSPAGSATSVDSFTVNSSSGPPRIDSFTPQIAAAATVITVAGANFDPSPQNDRVRINTSATALPTNVGVSNFQVSVPTQTGSGHITLDTPAGTAISSADLFIPPASHSVSQVAFTARSAVGTTATVSVGTTNGIGLLIFDGLAGHSVSLSTSAATFSSCTLQVYKPDYTTLGPSGSCSSATFLDSQKLPVTGTYTVLIAPGAGVTGSVAVTINDSTDLTTSVVPNGPALTLSITTSGQNARATFTGSAGMQATAQFTNNTLGSVTATLINPDASTLTSATSSSTNFNLPTVMLPKDGKYTVLVDAPGANTGSIVLSVSLVGGSRAVPPRSIGSVADPSNPLSQNLVGLFVMNEGSGTTDTNLADNQTANFSGTILPVWNTFDPSVNFQGGASLNSYLDAGTDLAFDQLTSNKMTVVAKVFMKSLAPGGIAEKNDNNTIAGFAFGLDNTGALVLNVVKSTNMRVATAAKTVASGQWVQVAFTWDGTVNTAAAAHIYVNGVEQTKVSSVDGTTGTIDASNATNKPFRIGNASFDTDSGSLNGKVAYLAVYRGRILTSAELSQLDSQLPIDALDVSGTVTPNSAPTQVAISSAGQNGRFFFSAIGGQNATIQLTNNTLGSVTVSLLNIDGTTLATTTSSGSSFSLPPVIMPVTDNYPIYIHPNGASSGTIDVGVSLINVPSRPTSAVLDLTSPLSTNLVGLFLMNEGSGTTDQDLVDSQTAAFSGTVLPTWDTTTPSIVSNGGGSLNSYVNAGTDLTFDQMPTSQITVVAKVYVPSVANSGIAEKGDNGASSGFSFGWDSNGAMRLIIARTGSNLTVNAQSHSIPVGAWIQVALTWDGTIGTGFASSAHLFVNGVEQSKINSSDGSGTLGYANATNQPFRIGNSYFLGSLNGKMAYLAVYRGRILSVSEMSQLDAQLPIH